MKIVWSVAHASIYAPTALLIGNARIAGSALSIDLVKQYKSYKLETKLRFGGKNVISLHSIGKGKLGYQRSDWKCIE
jgi:hypothetical protein